MSEDADSYVGGSREYHAEALRDAFGVLTAPRDYGEGDVIERKPGIETGQMTDRGGLAVCVEFRSPLALTLDTEDAGTCHAVCRYDLVIGHMLLSGAMVLHLTDSRFYRKASI